MTAVAHEQILAIGRRLRADGYHFVTPTPLTVARVRNRTCDVSGLRDVFGWNRAFDPAVLDQTYRVLLEQGDLLEPDGGLARSRIRFSNLGPLLLAHSGFPTAEQDAVFFGPDTYRFARALAELAADPAFRPRSMADVGAGTGAGGLLAASLFPSLERIVLGDINARALAFCAVNAALNDIAIARARHSDILSGATESLDLVIANPPYLVDGAQRAYRHGGGDWGCAIALRIVEQALARLTPRGQLLLYTGSPIVDGCDMFLEAVRPLLQDRAIRYTYEETDPDVFGEELERPPYNRADRIATVVLRVKAADLKR